ncbi:hypothetical protein P3T75_05800 [Enterococcus montenegrensis]|uniref:hypothetical protein n=1 Tax=Enterococcus montenegrensis TaxID=3031993 RepID=UPI00249DABDA|nr:hypothetical protein [Enterococcus montenegrensis]WHA10318.1 hypothetical protein P3T75_05800 [Enterococcus montenegrensis]
MKITLITLDKLLKQYQTGNKLIFSSIYTYDCITQQRQELKNYFLDTESYCDADCPLSTTQITALLDCALLYAVETWESNSNMVESFSLYAMTLFDAVLPKDSTASNKNLSAIKQSLKKFSNISTRFAAYAALIEADLNLIEGCEDLETELKELASAGNTLQQTAWAFFCMYLSVKGKSITAK